jgi:hypothetical protein
MVTSDVVKRNIPRSVNLRSAVKRTVTWRRGLMLSDSLGWSAKEFYGHVI